LPVASSCAERALNLLSIAFIYLSKRDATRDTQPTDISAVIKQNFVYRMLFRDIY